MKKRSLVAALLLTAGVGLGSCSTGKGGIKFYSFTDGDITVEHCSWEDPAHRHYSGDFVEYYDRNTWAHPGWSSIVDSYSTRRGFVGWGVRKRQLEVWTYVADEEWIALDWLESFLYIGHRDDHDQLI